MTRARRCCAGRSRRGNGNHRRRGVVPRTSEGGAGPRNCGDAAARECLTGRYRGRKPRTARPGRFAITPLRRWSPDGLAGDTRAKGAASGVSAASMRQASLSRKHRTIVDHARRRRHRAGGVRQADDYEILCQLPEKCVDAFAPGRKVAGVAVTSIGTGWPGSHFRKLSTGGD